MRAGNLKPLVALGGEPGQMSPEQALMVAVIQQALLDAGGSRSSVSPFQRGQAWSFLTDAAGPWARARADICDSLGVCPAWLRQQVLKAIQPPAVPNRRAA